MSNTILTLLETIIEQEPLEADSLREFFKEFLTSTFIIPTNNQQFEIPHEAKAENPFNDLLAMNTKDDSIYVPIFTDEEAKLEWYPNELDVRKIDGFTLCKKVPDGWGISLNPASELGKEFSSWEIQRLALGGEDEIEEIIAEHLNSEDSSVAFRPLTETEKTTLVDAITNGIDTKSPFTTIYCGVHISADAETFLFGALHKGKISDTEKSALENTLRQALIGNSEFNVSYGTDVENSPNLALFKFLDPIYPPSNDSQANDSQAE